MPTQRGATTRRERREIARADVVVSSGGLGPTADDLTRGDPRVDGHGGAEVVVGNYTEWQERMAQRQSSAAAPARRESTPKAKPAPETPARGKETSKLSYMPFEDVEAAIEKIETRLREIDSILSDLEVWKDQSRIAALSEEREKLQAELEPLEFEWGRRAELT